MSIRWDTRNKRWRYEFDRVIAGRRHRASRLLPRGWTQAQADAFDRTESGRVYAVASGIERPDPLIEIAVAHYLRDKRHLKSFKAAAEHLRAIEWAYTGKTMSELPTVAREVTERRVVAAVEGGRGEHTLTLGTARNRLALLKAACRWGWKQHAMTENDPTGRMQMPAANNERRVFLGRQAMLQAARATRHHQTCVAIRAAFYTGFRLGELYRVRVLGALLILDDTKNGEPRVVPASSRILTCLQHLPLTMNRNTLQRDWQRARAATVGAGVRFHDLRHSTASEMVNEGVPLHTIGKVLGHLDPRSTDRYSHLQTATLADAIATIGRRKVPHNSPAGARKKPPGEAA
jgi:integrase